jgi:hypothetical protein
MIVALAVVLALQVEIPVSAPLPAGVDAAKSWRLIRTSDGKELPVQLRAGSAFWIDSLTAGAKVSYRLEPGTPGSFPAVGCATVEGSHITFRFENKDVLRYNTGVVQPPAGMDPVYAYSGYLHPVRTPSGRAITGDFAKGNEHQHGIWSTWRHAEFEGRKVNAWAPLEKVGRAEFAKLDETATGPVFGGFRSRQRLLDPNAPGGPKPVLIDAWDVKVFATRDVRVFDLGTTQSCAGDSPLTVLKFHYGGLGVRGPADWEGKDGVAFLTSDGKTRLDGNGLPAKWVVMTGKIGGKDASVGLLCHPSSFRAPQPTRLNPGGPFFCWVPAADGPFEIAPGRPYAASYRFIASDRPLTPDEMNLHWAAYADPAGNVQLN